MPGTLSASSARIAWFATGGAQTERDRPAPSISLPPPEHVRALRGRGQVTIDWSPVAGAAGYLVHRGPASDGPFEPIDQSTGDLLAVPDSPYLDTTGLPGADVWYAVSSVSTIEAEGAGARYADNPYRTGGLLVSKRAFVEALDRDENLVEIFI